MLEFGERTEKVAAGGEARDSPGLQLPQGGANPVGGVATDSIHAKGRQSPDFAIVVCSPGDDLQSVGMELLDQCRIDQISGHP